MKNRNGVLNSVFLALMIFCLLTITCVLLTLFLKGKTVTLATSAVLGASVITMIIVFCLYGAHEKGLLKWKISKKNRYVK